MQFAETTVSEAKNRFMHQAGELKYRKAEIKDKDLYFKWVNDPEVRKLSYSKDVILYSDHSSWFEKKINDSDSLLLIFFDLHEVPLGQVRIDFHRDTGNHIISVSVDNAFRGKGFGSAVIRSACEFYCSQKHCEIITAYIFSSNRASARSFLKAGFVFESEKIIQDIPSSVMVKKC